MPRPNSACSRRRHRRCTNIYSFIWPWRSIVARSAARLRRTVGPLSRHGACRTGTPITSLRHTIPKSPDITGHHRTSPDITGQSDIVGQKRVVACGIICCRIVCHRVGRVREEPVPDRVRYRRSRARGAGAGSRAVKSVAGERSRRRARHQGWSSCAVSPGAGSRAVSPVARSRLVTSRPPSATSRLCDAHGQANRTPVVCHAPAQHGAVADAANRCLRTYFLLFSRRALWWHVRRRG